MDNKSVSSSIRNFINTNFPSARNRALSDADLLLESGIIDSLGVLDMVSFIESQFGIHVEDDELVPENFQTIEQIARFIERTQRERV